ncbi:hypothetical protein HV339_07600 [Enterobacter sp. RHBSTW-00974]|nr:MULTISPECIES: hypothetical protein [unclassified Enterobacter]MBA7770947.1 hypothetical protein [Enterobacter sp. RHBSTW-00974]
MMYYELWFFDSFIEPQGPVYNDFYQARLVHTIEANNPNLTKEYRKKLNMKDHLLIKDSVFKSQEEIEKEKEQQELKRKKAVESMFDPALLGKVRISRSCLPKLTR